MKKATSEHARSMCRREAEKNLSKKKYKNEDRRQVVKTVPSIMLFC